MLGVDINSKSQIANRKQFLMTQTPNRDYRCLYIRICILFGLLVLGFCDFHIKDGGLWL